MSPLDVFVLLKLAANAQQKKAQSQIAAELFLSPSSVNATIKVAGEVKLYDSNQQRVNALALQEALTHSSKYFLPVIKGGVTRGVVTGISAPPMDKLVVQADELPFVWPDPLGEVRGISFSPLYKTAAAASRIDSNFYELLTLVDVLREGHARESKIASEQLRERLRK